MTSDGRTAGSALRTTLLRFKSNKWPVSFRTATASLARVSILWPLFLASFIDRTGDT